MWPLDVRPVSHPSLAREWYNALAAPLHRSGGAADPSRKILVINGHPDPRPDRFCAALCAAYAAGARSQGWETRELRVGGLGFGGDDPDALRQMPPDVADAVQAVRWASRLAIVFPLWLDRPPPPLSRLFDAVAGANAASQQAPSKRRRPARVVVTMGLPAFTHRARCREDASGMARSLALTDVPMATPVFIGSIDAISAAQRAAWLRRLHVSGVRGF